MSDLYRSAIHSRISKLPPLPALESEDEEKEDVVGSLPAIRPLQVSTGSRSQRSRQSNPAFSPLSASDCFDQAAQVTVPESKTTFQVYYTPPKLADGTVIVCHHGAGYSALTFACFAKHVSIASQRECGVLSFDCRGHGKTISTESPQPVAEDLSIDVLTSDLVNLLKISFPDVSIAPTILLVGHSLGGPVVVRACPLLQDKRYKITGVCVLDVVEEFTMEALPMMHSLLDSRPEGFGTLDDAIEWHVKTKTIRNAESARISVPSIFTKNPGGVGPTYVWRTPLHSTAPYWESWFTGLSGKFLSVRTARLLVLAGAERLDKELMIGQMQGKFQLTVIAGVGHMLQEDDPTYTAELIVEFWRRNERVVMGIKKVGEI